MERGTPDTPDDALARITVDYDAVKARLATVGFICEGSLVQRYMPCGKPGCRCADPDQLHGPYRQLSWKRDGKTVSRRLTSDQAALYAQWIANRHQLESLIAQLHTISRTAHALLLGGSEHSIPPPADPPSARPADA